MDMQTTTDSARADVPAAAVDESNDKSAERVAAEQGKYSFHLSPMAARKLYESLNKRGTPNAALRVGVRGGGCSGYSYVLEFDDREPRSRGMVFS